jgi:endoglucanase
MDTKLVKEILQIVGPSGHEGPVAEYIKEAIKDYVDECYTDALGNLIAHKKANGPKMMLAGHMDQIGLMVTHIDDKGFIRFGTIGGFSPYILFNQRVRFSNGTVGVVRSERVEDMKNSFGMDKLYIDLGAADKAEAESKVKIGDVCVYAAETYVDDKIIMSPSLDDRIGCVIQIEAAKRLKNPVYDTYFVFTVQEELGLKGARTSGYTVDPDYCVAYDVTSSSDTPNSLKLPQKMFAGACIKIKDSSLICAPEMVNFMEKVAKENNIKHQFEILTAGGTDSGAVQLSRKGVVAGVISVATRNVHSDSELCSVSDVDDCIELTVKMLETKIK